MSAFTRKIATMSIAFGLLAGGIIGLILYYALPQFYPSWYLGIVFFFLILETLLISFVSEKGIKVSARKMVNVYMLAKVVKILLSLVFVLAYILIVKEGVKNFVIIFIVFYLLYLGIETYLFSQIEKQIKRENKI